jgi:hypothetical protein
LEALLLPTATSWRQDIRTAAKFTAVTRTDGKGLFFLHPAVGSVYVNGGDGIEKTNTNTNANATGRTNANVPAVPAAPIKGGNQSTCIGRGTCFASMTAGLPGGGSNQHTNYANFRIFAETLLAGVLDPEYEEAIMNFRETHRGTLLGMTRFRDLLDDMPILGYGKSSLDHDRVTDFHATLAGHTMNYITRGTYWGTEQRQQLDYKFGNGSGIDSNRWRNNCGVGGEDCSLCMVSSIPSSFWIRWMLVSESSDIDQVFLARGAPRRWYEQGQPFGISNAPTRFGRIDYSLQVLPASIMGVVRVSENKNNTTVHTDASRARADALRRRRRYMHSTPLLMAVKLRSPSNKNPVGKVEVFAQSAGLNVVLVCWHAGNETAVFQLDGELPFSFNITARFI